MKYLCLVYIDEKAARRHVRKRFQRTDSVSLAYDDELRRSGLFIVAEALESVQAARTLRPQEGKIIITDGPFAETKEQLGGFILVDAKDFEAPSEWRRRSRRRTWVHRGATDHGAQSPIITSRTHSTTGLPARRPNQIEPFLDTLDRPVYISEHALR